MQEKILEDKEILEEFFKDRMDVEEEQRALANILKENKELQKSVDEIYADYQDIGKEMFKCNEENERLKNENNELKAVILKNHDLYETKCNENKELREENKSLVRQYEYQGAKMVNEYMSFKNVKKLFIPKSLVKEKIEELDERIKNPERTSCWASYTIGECIGIRRILQDLLGEE